MARKRSIAGVIKFACRDVRKDFNRQESSNDRWVFGPRAHCSLRLARYTFENAYSRRCIFLDFGGKIKGIQDRLLSGNG